jgi:transposase-like protein
MKTSTKQCCRCGCSDYSPHSTRVRKIKTLKGVACVHVHVYKCKKCNFHFCDDTTDIAPKGYRYGWDIIILLCNMQTTYKQRSKYLKDKGIKVPITTIHDLVTKYKK